MRIWKAIKSASRYKQWYKQSFNCFAFFAGLSYSFYFLISFLSSWYAGLIVIGLLVLCLSIFVPAIEKWLEEAERKFYEDQAIKTKIKQELRDDTLYQVEELSACLLHPNRYSHKDSYCVPAHSNSSIYLYIIPDFIYEALNIPEDKRCCSPFYYTRELRLTNSSLSNTQLIKSDRYRPSEEDVKLAFPTILKSIENALTPYVDPLQQSLKISDKYTDRLKYIAHLIDLIRLLKEEKFDDMSVYRKAYNLMHK